MALNIKDPATDRLARKLAARTGASITVAVREAIEDKLKAVERKDVKRGECMMEAIREIQARVAALPDLTPKSPHELVEYDGDGLPI